WVGEFGVCTENRPFTQEDRRRILLETAGVLRQLNSIQGVNLYRMRDGAEPGCEGSFGIQEQTWAREVLQAMR
ncbi:MAG: hypothetical protein Q7K38_02315, partial [Candidatus Wildermuthbacteria bacterium]|nr:hypothetical protein [Candidatus Wildermuthbacteria bacterium]